MIKRLTRRTIIILILVLIPGILAVLAMLFWWLRFGIGYSPTRHLLGPYLRDPSQHASLITDLSAPCTGAQFLLPSRGFVGLLYADPSAPYTPLNKHPGIDIFGDGKPGSVPVYAAYDGYLTRFQDWKSSVIIRVPQDPLDKSRQIWLYYAHMASQSGNESYISREFPPGTSEKFVKQGTLLGYQGLYAGTSALPIKMHVHFSVVSSDSDGSFRNESRFQNTLDPSPYFGLTLNAEKPTTIPVNCDTNYR